MSPDARPRIGFIGAGRTATALAIGLSHVGYEVVAVSSLHFDSALRLATRISGCWALLKPQEVVDFADFVFVTTPDAAIRDVAASLRWRAGVAVVHTSGVETREVLSLAADQGGSTGSFHPLQTFADRASGADKLAGSFFGIEAEGDLRETLTLMASNLGGRPVFLNSADKALYHAAAVFASNYVVTLSKLASDLWLRFGYDRETALQALLPLMRGAVDNITTLGLPDALTGPIARGDVRTVGRHIDALPTAAPEILQCYRQLAIATLPLAVEGGQLSEQAAGELQTLLSNATLTGTMEGTRRA